MSQLAVQPAWRLADRPEQQRRLVDGPWPEAAVGIIDGEPKGCKSFLALDLPRPSASPACVASPRRVPAVLCSIPPKTHSMSSAAGPRASAPWP
jgi:hypothetical protein